MSTKAKILLVDDEVLVRDELGALLQDEGYEVVTAVDGDEGLSLFRTASPDFVITDVRMPRRDGLSLAISIRQESPIVPIAVITGHGTEVMAIEALRAGVTDFIKKPVRLDGLLAALQRMEAALKRHTWTSFDEVPRDVHLVHCTWSYRLQSNLEAIPPFVELLLRRSSEGMDRDSALKMSLALRELLINAIEHGSLSITSEEKNRALENGTLKQLLEERAASPAFRERQVTVTVLREDRLLTVTIADEGPGFDWRSLPDSTEPSNLLSAHGRGVLLARLFSDSLSFNEAGNAVTVQKKL